MRAGGVSSSTNRLEVSSQSGEVEKDGEGSETGIPATGRPVDLALAFDFAVGARSWTSESTSMFALDFALDFAPADALDVDCWGSDTSSSV